MKTVHIILSAVILAALCGCRAHRNQTPVPETVTLQATMSTREVHTQHTDTVYIRIPAQESERETFDSVSVLESDYAVSEAQIRPDGSLRHSLRHKITPLPVQVSVTTDTIYKDRVIEKPVPVKVHDTAPSAPAKSFRSTVLSWLIATATTILLVLIAVKHLRTRF
jgi:hypothetical protein